MSSRSTVRTTLAPVEALSRWSGSRAAGSSPGWGSQAWPMR
ncbi:hypothetical protein ACFQ71_08895 [Streptomyces sp. NPDC056534]